MTNEYRTYGNLALRTPGDGSSRAVVPVGDYRQSGNGTYYPVKSPVEETLDNIEGTPMAITAGDRRFAVSSLAVASLIFVVLTSLPIF